MRGTSRWAAALVATAAVAGLASACDVGVGSGGTGSAPSASSTDAALTIPITIAGGQVKPNGEKITAKLGQPIVLQVTSDQADEIHAHTGGDGYELEVPANTPTTGTFTPSQAGSFEVESHHLNKVIVVLDVS